MSTEPWSYPTTELSWTWIQYFFGNNLLHRRFQKLRPPHTTSIRKNCHFLLENCIFFRGGSRRSVRSRKHALRPRRVVRYYTYAPVAQPTPSSLGDRAILALTFFEILKFWKFDCFFEMGSELRKPKLAQNFEMGSDFFRKKIEIFEKKNENFKFELRICFLSYV